MELVIMSNVPEQVINYMDKDEYINKTKNTSINVW